MLKTMARTVEQSRDMIKSPPTNVEYCRRTSRLPARAVSYHFASKVAGFVRACEALECGSLLPLWYQPACRLGIVLAVEIPASKLAGLEFLRFLSAN
jgi:hypothetical protein